MSIKNNHLKSGTAAGAVLVALSGLVPAPLLVGSARAATATINFSGSFVTGIKLVAGQALKFGTLAAIAGNGSLVVSTAGVLTPKSAVKVAGATQKGSYKFTAASTTPNVDFTLKKMGALTLVASKGGLGPVGTAKLVKVSIGKAATAAAKFTAAGTTAKVAGYNITKKTTKLLVGGTITWGATQPIGGYTGTLVLTASY